MTALGISVGDKISTSYGAGPYRVETVLLWENEIQMSLTADDWDRPGSLRGYVSFNGISQKNGRWFLVTSTPGRSELDELIVEPQSQMQLSLF